MIRPYSGYVLVEEVDNTKKLGGFIIDSDKNVCKGKVLKLPRNTKMTPNGYCQVLDFVEGDIILYNSQGVVYEDRTETSKVMLVDIESVVGVEENE